MFKCFKYSRQNQYTEAVSYKLFHVKVQNSMA